MRIDEILNLIPSAAALVDATNSWLPADPGRQRLFQARDALEKLYRETKQIALLDVADLLPHDFPIFEQLIADGRGQEIVRQNIVQAKSKLEKILHEGDENV